MNGKRARKMAPKEKLGHEATDSPRSLRKHVWDDEYQRFAEWNDSEQKLFGTNHFWEETSAEEWGDDVILHKYRCRRCNSEHAVRFYSNGLKIDIDYAGNCDEKIIMSVQEG